MEKYIVLAVVVVGLVGLFCLVNSTSLTGMASQRHIFFSENICGNPNEIPMISKVWEAGKSHTFIYDCIPKGEKIQVQTSKFKLDERQQAQRLTDYIYIYKYPNR